MTRRRCPRWFMGILRFMGILLAQTFLVSSVVTADDHKMSRVDVFVSGTEGYHSYRIPSIITSAEGTVLAFCEGRKNSRGDSGDIDLLLKRSRDNGKTWSEATVVWDDGRKHLRKSMSGDRSSHRPSPLATDMEPGFGFRASTACRHLRRNTASVLLPQRE